MKISKSRAWFDRARSVSPGGVHSPVRAFKAVAAQPFVVKKAQGAYLYDVDGNKFIDYVGSWGPLVLGHAHPVVEQALCEQAALGTSYGTCSTKEIELAELIVELVPNIEMLRFVNSGTEATMSAMRLARGYTGKNKIIKFTGCYHGHSDALLVEAGSGMLTLSIPASPGVSENMVRDTLCAKYNDIASVEHLFAENEEDIAAVIIEPVVGNCGLIKPQDSFLTKLRTLCSKHNSLLIFDEVMTGFRVALQGAQGLYDVEADIVCLGKVIGGGLPVGAYGAKKELMSQMAPQGSIYQAGTLSGNPLAMAAGHATLTEWSKHAVFDETASLTKELVHSFNELSLSYGIDLYAESVGTMFGISFQKGSVTDYDSAIRADAKRFEKFFQLCLEKGVFFAPSQFEAGFFSVGHKGEALARTQEVLKGVFEKL